jgi:hypothetical protein
MRVEVDVIRHATLSAGDARCKKWFWFAIANVVSFALAGGIFAVLLVGLPEGLGFDQAMDRVRQFLRSHMGVFSLAASTPFFASLIVGQDEAGRARAPEEVARSSPPSSPATRSCAKPAAPSSTEPVLRAPIADGHPCSCIGP